MRRMVPAKKCFYARQLEIVQRELRLEPNFKLAFQQRLSQFIAQPALLLGRVLHRSRKERTYAAAFAFGVIQCQIGVGEQLFDISGIVRGYRDPYTCSHKN